MNVNGITKNPRKQVARFLDTDELTRLGRALDAHEPRWPEGHRRDPPVGAHRLPPQRNAQSALARYWQRRARAWACFSPPTKVEAWVQTHHPLTAARLGPVVAAISAGRSIEGAAVGGWSGLQRRTGLAEEAALDGLAGKSVAGGATRSSCRSATWKP